MENFENTVRLMRQARDGNREALSHMMRRFEGPLLERVRKMMGPIPRGYAQSADVLQELFLKICESFNAAEIEDEEAFLRWATHMARNTIRDHARRQRVRRVETLATTVMARGLPGGASDARPSQVAARKDEVARLESALAELSEDYRRVIELRDIQQFSYQEIAEVMKRPSEAAAQMLHARALSRLSEKLLRRA
ncbi:MAG: sigma-70 family RNA polymerase sigma factor [Planctomycetota bacterium]